MHTKSYPAQSSSTPSNPSWLMSKLFLVLMPYLPTAMLLLSVIFFSLTAYYALVWQEAANANQAYLNRSILKMPLDASKPLHAYSIGYLKAAKISRRNDVEEAAKAFSMAEITDQPALRARAKFASANLYFDLAIQASKIAEGGAHQQAVAQIELARESYKNALRIDPDLHVAKFNLELLDRMSPEKRTQGWQAETDGVTLQPFKRNGTAMMKDNTRRGLP